MKQKKAGAESDRVGGGEGARMERGTEDASSREKDSEDIAFEPGPDWQGRKPCEDPGDIIFYLYNKINYVLIS